MQIFRSHEATKSEEIPKQYVYKKIESPRDYLNYDETNYYSEPSFFEENKKEEKMDTEKMDEKNLKNDAKDEITFDNNIQKAPEEAIISPPQVPATAGGTFSHGQITAPESHANQESPISFYARRISVTSLKSGEPQQQQQNVPGFSSPPPPAPPPPPPKSAIRIPATSTTTNNENTKELKEKVIEASAIKGGVSVIVPGLMDAAKESIERRQRGRTLSPENKNKIISSGPTPYRSPSVFGTSSSATTINNTRMNGITTTTNHGVVTRMNTQTPTSDTFLFRPRSQTARNIETTQKTTSEDYFHPDNRQFQNQKQQQRMFSTSPTPSGTFLLGQSVFKPVNEVEKIRDNFNRKCESRGASVAGGGYSRSPSVMSQSYHDGGYDSYTPYRDNTSHESSALRHRFPIQSFTASNDYPAPFGQTPTPYGQTTGGHKWNIRNNTTSDDVFNRLPTGATRSKLIKFKNQKH
uniref:Uncharacterized protein n=1 Tax=Panagrolaimus sp. PS1159 TaxID=55785 RepID=A0AC35FYC4_9BILA